MLQHLCDTKDGKQTKFYDKHMFVLVLWRPITILYDHIYPHMGRGLVR